MRIEKYILPYLIFCLLLFSCSSEEGEPEAEASLPEKASLVLGAVLNNLVSEREYKQQQNALCDSLIPFFAEVVLSQNGELVAGTMEEPLRMRINGNVNTLGGRGNLTGDSTLLLDPGNYVLEQFSVTDEEGQIIWLAPSKTDNDSPVEDLVAEPLPMDLVLQAGVQHYANVEVICFDNSYSNSVGFVSSELEEITQTIGFCIFGSLCDDNGRHFPFVEFEVNVWSYSGDPENPQGDSLYMELENELQEIFQEDSKETVGVPLCFSLPDSLGEDFYYLEISLKDSVDVIRSGVISDAQVKELFTTEGGLEYYHFREGNCNLEDTPLLLEKLPE